MLESVNIPWGKTMDVELGGMKFEATGNEKFELFFASRLRQSFSDDVILGFDDKKLELFLKEVQPFMKTLEQGRRIGLMNKTKFWDRYTKEYIVLEHETRLTKLQSKESVPEYSELSESEGVLPFPWRKFNCCAIIWGHSFELNNSHESLLFKTLELKQGDYAIKGSYTPIDSSSRYTENLVCAVNILRVYEEERNSLSCAELYSEFIVARPSESPEKPDTKEVFGERIFSQYDTGKITGRHYEKQLTHYVMSEFLASDPSRDRYKVREKENN